MARRLRSMLARLRGERGFTLVEMLVSGFVGTIILLVLLNLVDASQSATARVEGRVDSTQRGRVAMEQVAQRLRAQTCLGSLPPIVAGDGSSVTFFSDLGDDDEVPEKRVLYVSGGHLWEELYEGVGELPSTTFPTLTVKRRLVDGVGPAKDDAGASLPYFRYYAYDSGTTASPSVEVKPPFAADDTKRIVRVMVAFKAALPDKNYDKVDTDFVTAATMRHTDPASTDPTRRGPQCG
jgi:Prokaryotic N-terminal methylation motif